MAMQKGTETTATTKMRDNVHDTLKRAPFTISDLAEALGYSEKVIYYRIKELRDSGLVELVGRRGRHDLWLACDRQVIPQIPSASGLVNPVVMLRTIAERPDYKSKLEQLLENWNMAFVNIWHNVDVQITEGVYNDERATEIQSYLKLVRSELEVKLRQVNTLLSSGDLWDAQAMDKFKEDAAWAPIQGLTRKAWQGLLQKKKIDGTPE